MGRWQRGRLHRFAKAKGHLISGPVGSNPTRLAILCYITKREFYYMSDIRIIELSANEAEQHLARIVKLESCFGDDAFSTEELLQYLHYSTHIIAVFVDTKIVCYVATEDISYPPYRYIWQLITDKEYRGMGYARRVLNYLINKTQNLSLHVRKDNNIAMRLYKDFGFVVDNIELDMYSDGTDGLYMTLQ